MRLGILIIGSLYWDGSPIRCAWRLSRLSRSRERRVKVPIRYGRCSDTRGGTFTMVFAMSCSEPGSLGVGIVASARMECLRPGQLLEEAEHLWAAERNEEKLGGISADWGAVCVLRNPSAGPPQEILDAWHARVKAARKSYVAFPVAEGEEQFFDAATGYALCTWPTDCETNQPLVGFDLLLMTATKPTLNGNQYPTTQEIAQAWRADDGGNVRYFYNNRHHGITTFQDPQILSLLRNELS